MRAVAPKSLPAATGYADIGCSVKYMRCMLVSCSESGPEARPASRSGGEFADELRERFGLLHVHEVASLLHHGEPAAGQGPCVRLAAHERHNPGPTPPRGGTPGATSWPSPRRSNRRSRARPASPG